MYLLKYTGTGGGPAKAIGTWLYDTWVYGVILGTVYGVTVGWFSRKLLQFAAEKHYVDRESFLVFAVTLGLFTLGTCGLIGTDDLLACFIAGYVFSQE
ncbi:hypothetical protein EYZ11_010379 [Aspergillus tanneri]|uniref:Uncharacterized protein n=1 Tax=Aspergillus tanneri TaxID=1220188 RepID=A0A4S3J616_9EURO|nr:hypothetical protein EYZ11_010379 [Aspergillus tanneri]